MSPHKRTVIKEEDRNTKLVLHTGLSAYTGDPENLALAAASSEGKTHLAKNTVDMFPDSDVEIYKSISPKAFTRERGVEVVPNSEAQKIEDAWTDEIYNKFEGKKQKVSEYKDFLYKNRKVKEGSNAKYDTEEIAKELEELKQKVATKVDLRNKIIVFTEEPNREFWAGFLAVLSHDTYWTKTKFVEGDGVKRTRQVLFQGWPAVIYCTSKTDTGFGWKDLNTRFEVIEPIQTAVKYKEAVRKVFDDMFSRNDHSEYNVRQAQLKEEVRALVERLRNRQVKAFTPFQTEELWGRVGDIKFGSLMRTLKYWGQHLQMETFWNLGERSYWVAEGTTYVLVGMDDITAFWGFYDMIELQAELNGLAASAAEFYLNVLLTLQEASRDKGRLSGKAPLYSADVARALSDYVEANKQKTRLKSRKDSMSRYGKELQSKHFVTIEKPEEEGKRRERIWTPLVPKEEMAMVAETVAPIVVAESEAAFFAQKLALAEQMVAQGPRMKEEEVSGKNADGLNIPNIVSKMLKMANYATITATIPATVVQLSVQLSTQPSTEKPSSHTLEGCATIPESSEILEVSRIVLDLLGRHEREKDGAVLSNGDGEWGWLYTHDGLKKYPKATIDKSMEGLIASGDIQRRKPGLFFPGRPAEVD